MPSITGLPIVGVIGSGREAHEDLATPLGTWLATQSVHLVTGAGQGVMAAVSKAFAETPDRKGLVLGIVPCIAEQSPQVSKPGYPNEWVEVPIRTHLHLSGPQGEDPRSRNHIVALTANVLVALPGGPGTASEVRLALRYHKQVIAYLNSREEIPALPIEVRWERDLDAVKAFITQALAKLGG
jgi:uncharacterized protein (TIGR00725 family)